MSIKDIKSGMTFSKTERLCSKKSIDTLFSKGISFIAYPLRVVYLCEESDSTSASNTSQILVSISKKRFKRAVKRNRIKRLIREAYRLHKHKIIEQAENKNINTSIAFLYIKNELPTYQEIDKAMIKAIGLLTEKLNTV